MAARGKRTSPESRPRSRRLLFAILSVGLVSALSSACVTLDKGSEANVPTVTCVLVFGDGCRFDNEDQDKTLQVEKKGDEKTIKKTRTKPFPPIGQHTVP